MKLSRYLVRWTTTKAALALAGALAICGAVGGAFAISPTVPVPIRWQTIAEFTFSTTGSNAFKAYTVPAGRNFLLTDLVVTNRGTLQETFGVGSGNGGVCGGASLKLRLQDLYVASGENVILAFQTGIPFGPGQGVCVSSSNANLVFNGRGFLFTSN